MNIILNIIGVMIYFINRFANRTKKTVAFDFKYWIKDNWPELSTVILIDLALMLMLQMKISDGSLDLALSKLPEWINILGVPGICLGLGLGLSSLFYSLFKKKISDVKKG